MNEDKATKYHRLQRRTTLLSTATLTGVLLALALSGASIWLRELTQGWTARMLLSVAAYVTALVLLCELVQLPFAWYQEITLERRYGLSTETVRGWWTTRAKGFLLGTLFGICATWIVVGLASWSERWWWLAAGGVFAVLLLGLARLAPVLLLPIFYELTPLERPALSSRLLHLAERAGAPVLGIFEWRLSDRTRKANAALAGMGRTRRILLSDTLLAGHSDEEIEVILAHELAHHVHHDIWSGLAVQAFTVTLALFAADRVLAALGPGLGYRGSGDPAALPLMLLAASAVTLAGMPVFNAMSRAQERRADRFALEMTKNPDAFVTAMRRLGSQNLAEEFPSRVTEILFCSHPPMHARIAAARAWGAGRG